MSTVSKVLFLLILSLSSQCCGAKLQSLPLYISAHGQNISEAKIAAHKDGMQRALMLIASRLSIHAFGGGDISYRSLQAAFDIIDVDNEKISENTYSADVIYQYNQQKVNKLLLQYGGSGISDYFYEYLVIPIAKARGQIIIWQPGVAWLDLWKNNNQNLRERSLLYSIASITGLSSLSGSTILHSTYEDLAPLVTNQMFKKIAIICCEEFKPDASGKMRIKIDYLFLGPETQKSASKVLDISAINEYNKEVVLQGIIKQFAEDYGRKQDISATANNQSQLIELKASITSSKALEELKTRLAKINGLYDWHFSPINHGEVSIRARIIGEIRDLAEELYIHDLSYKRVGIQSYLLIDLKNKGV